MGDIEDMMRNELDALGDKIRENQRVYRELRRAYDKKRKAMNEWFKPIAKPRIRRPEDAIASKPTEEKPTEQSAEQQST